MIQKLGYTVHVAESGTKALELYLKHKGRIHLVILDMIMMDKKKALGHQGLCLQMVAMQGLEPRTLRI